MRDRLAEAVIADQKSSLDAWVDCLSSPDALYTDWLKYWAMRSVLGMGGYDKKKKRFNTRSEGTTQPFPDINREALAYVLDAVSKKYGRQHVDFLRLSDDEKKRFETLLESESFPKLYAWALEKVSAGPSGELLRETSGTWVTYRRNSDEALLVESLLGHNTGWCTAGDSTARIQLKGGDFHVYYSLDERGKPSVPRVAIRMEEGKIAEVRGVAEQQNLDPYITHVVESKLAEFPDGAVYKKKTGDMKRLTELERRMNAGEQPAEDDLAFLYELHAPVEGFGYEKDPRIKELLQNRDTRADIAHTLGISPREVSMTEKEALSGCIIFHYGNLDLSHLTSAEGLTLPQSVGGIVFVGKNISTKELDGLQKDYSHFFIKSIS